MKRLTVILLLIIIALMGWNYFNKPNSSPISPGENKKQEATNKQSVVIDIDGIAMRVTWVEVDPENLELYSNLETKLTSSAIQEERNCKALVNGGFYSKEDKHIGLLIASSGQISPAQTNSLFNGFISIDTMGAEISTTQPTNSRLAVQTGPIIFSAGKPKILSIRNDEQARRIVAATTTSDNKLIFLAVYRDGSEFQGPFLEELPKIIEKFNQNSQFKIQNSINLDGGSASAFITDFVNLPERTLIGSYFCEK